MWLRKVLLRNLQFSSKSNKQLTYVVEEGGLPDVGVGERQYSQVAQPLPAALLQRQQVLQLPDLAVDQVPPLLAQHPRFRTLASGYSPSPLLVAPRLVLLVAAPRPRFPSAVGGFSC